MIRSRVWPGLLVVAMSVAAGVTIALVSAQLVLYAAVATMLIAASHAVRQSIPRFTLPRYSLTGPIESVDDGRFRIPRILMFAGLLTSCWLQARFHGVTVSDGLFLLAVGSALCEQTVYRYEGAAILPSNVWVGIALFVVGGVISTIQNSHHQIASLAIVARVFYLIGAWLWAGGVAFRTPRHIRTAMGCWVASAAICGAWALGQKYGHLPGNLDNGRFAGLADHVNDLGALCACALVPALSLVYRDRRWALAFLGIAIGLLLSESIGAAIAAMVALAFGLVARELTKATLVALTVGAMGIVIAGPLIGSSAITRFSTATNSGAQVVSQNTLGTRTRIYADAWRYIESDPLVGKGFDTTGSSIYDSTTGQYFQVHNLFLGSWYQGGLLSLVGIVVLITTLGKMGWTAVSGSVDRLTSLALFSGFIAYVADELSEPSLYKRYSLVPALLIVALHRLATNEQYARRRPRAWAIKPQHLQTSGPTDAPILTSKR